MVEKPRISTQPITVFRIYLMMKKAIFPMLVVFVTLCGYSSPTEAPKLHENHQPDNLMPKLYDLELFTDLMASRPKFWGTVRITVECLVNTNTISLNYNSKIEENKVKIKILQRESVSSIVDIEKHEFDADTKILKIFLKDSLEKNRNYEVEIEFPEKSVTYFYGYSRIYYAENKQMAYFSISDSTTFGVMFPCFADLRVKMKFKIRHGHLNTQTAISNAKLRSTTEVSNSPNWVLDEFEEIVPIQTNDLVIAVLDLDPTMVSDASLKTEIRIFANKSVINQIGDKKNVIAPLIRFFLDYFEIQFELEKLDIVVFPDKSSKTSVLYGVIFFSENSVLNMFQITNSFDEFNMVSEMCHVISKQWIGNAVELLTPEFRWIHLGLNIFLQTLCVKEINPKWEFTFMESRIIASFTNIFRLDHSTGNAYYSPPMGISSTLYNMYSNYEVERAYHLIRMINFLLGQDAFKKSMRNYIDLYKFSYTKMEDLWNTFTDNIDSVNSKLKLNYFTVDEIMRSWIHQEGYPLITVTRNDETKSITITQEPFDSLIEKEEKLRRIENPGLYFMVTDNEEYLQNLNKEEQQEKQQRRCWMIPLSYTTKNELNFKDPILREWSTCNGPQELIVYHLNKDDWILFDPTVTVPGRVNYDEENWVSIQKSLANKDESAAFDALTRARLISDMLVLAEIGRLSYAFVFDTIKYLPQEENYEHWKLVLTWFNQIRLIFFRTSFYGSFQKYVRKLLKPMVQKTKYGNIVPFETGDYYNNELKKLIIESSCTFGVKSCLQTSHKLIKNRPDNLIPQVIHDTIHCQEIKHGRNRYWYHLWNLYDEKKEASIRKSILKALGCSTDSKILLSYLKSSINGDKIHPDDTLMVFQSLSSNKIGYKVMKKFFLENYDEIYSFYNNNEFMSTDYLTNLLDITVERNHLIELIDFAKSKKIFDKRMFHLKASLMRAIKNIEWLEKNEKQLEAYFNNKILNKIKIQFGK